MHALAEPFVALLIVLTAGLASCGGAGGYGGGGGNMPVAGVGPSKLFAAESLATGRIPQ